MKHFGPAMVLLGFTLLSAMALAGEHGAEIEDPVVVNHHYAAVDYYGTNDFSPTVALDGQGNGVAVWTTRAEACEPLAAVTSNWGRTWSRHIPLKTSAAVWRPPLHHERPVVATDRQGTWITAWSTNDSLGDTIDPAWDIVVTRSSDRGQSWTDPEPVSAGYVADSREPQIATDGLGTWGVVWCGAHIGFTRSVDNGASWEHWVELAGIGMGFYRDVALATDGAGTWVIAWTHPEVYYVFSTDNGATWSPTNILASGSYQNVVLEAHSNGTWVAVFQYYDGDFDLAYSRSTDVRHWSDPQPLNSDAATDGWAVYDEHPEIRVDEHGHWLTAWHKWGVDNIFGAESYDDGVTWTDLAPLHNDIGEWGEFRPALADDGASNWLMVWDSINILGGTILNDYDILSNSFRLPFSTSCASDADRDGYGSPGDPFCPLGGAIDCADTELRVAPRAMQSCDGLNNDCDHPLWPSLEGTNEVDDDGDGMSECGGDCNDDDDHSWALPGDARDLVLSRDEFGIAMLDWDPPEEKGGDPVALIYDVIRSEAPFACRRVGPQTCVETDDGTDTAAVDATIPPPGKPFFYLVRAENGCPGPGVLGSGDYAPFRLARVCR